MASSQTRREREDNVCETSERWDQSPICFNSILMEPTIIAHVCKYSISFLSMQMKNGVNTRQLYALPSGRRRVAAALAARQPMLPRPHYHESGQARVHSGERPLASLERSLRLQSRQLGSSTLSPFTPRGLSLLLPRAGETVVAEAVHRLARPYAQQARPRRRSGTDGRLANSLLGGSGRGRQPPNPPLQSLAVLPFQA